MKAYHVKSFLLFFAMILPMLNGWASQQSLVTLSDQSGDDYGAGTLTYPQRADFQTGDLDLIQLKISRDEGGFWLEARFRNPIRDPGSVANAVSSQPLATFARKGFYQFNIDVYVDTDRAKGSGNTFTLPGRHVLIDPAYAWERAVILTPRPELMRQQLLGALIEQFPERSKAETEASIDQAMFFPTRIRVRGKSIAFFVPASFFSGSDGTDWAVTALVTGAMTSIPVDLSLFPSTKTPLERLQLGVMQPVAGHPKDTFGYSGAIPSPVVDMLGSSAEQQMRQLMAKDGLTGVSWGPHAVNDAQMAAVASDATIMEQKSAGSIIAKPVVPIGNLFQPESSAAAQSRETRHTETRPTETRSGEAMPLADPSIVRRLQTLQQLFDQKLIDDAEYKQQKQRILKDL